MGEKYKDALKELKIDMACYRRLANDVTGYDGMEIENILSCRDGIKISLEMLKKEHNVSSYLEELRRLDEKFIKHIRYVQKAMDTYYCKSFKDEFDVSHWWWYLDEVVRGDVKIEFNEDSGMYEGIWTRPGERATNPIEEIDYDLSMYGQFSEKADDYNRFQIYVWLEFRDNIKETLEALKGQSDISAYLNKLRRYDENLMKHITHIQKNLRGYTAKPNDIAHWWWYLDDVADGKLRIEFNEQTGMYEGKKECHSDPRTK